MVIARWCPVFKFDETLAGFPDGTISLLGTKIFRSKDWRDDEVIKDSVEKANSNFYSLTQEHVNLGFKKNPHMLVLILNNTLKDLTS